MDITGNNFSWSFDSWCTRLLSKEENTGWLDNGEGYHWNMMTAIMASIVQLKLRECTIVTDQNKIYFFQVFI